MKRFLTSILIFCAALSAAQNFNVSTDLKGHVEYLSSNALKGRAAGCEGERKAAEYLFNQLSSAGVVMLTDENGQDFSIRDSLTDIHSLNIVGIVEGFDQKLREEYIVVGAHIDGMGVNRMTFNGEEVEQVYPGADANASGMSMLIELARQVSECRYMFPRSIIFAGFGAGEKGTAGSWYFVNRAFSEIGKVRAMIDLNMLGHMSKNNPFTLLTQVSSSDIGHLMNLTQSEPVVTVPQMARGISITSDYLPFYEKKIPIFCFSTGISKDYRTVRDQARNLAYDGMEQECNYIFYFLKSLSCCEEDMPVVDREKQRKASAQDRANKIYTVAECDKRPQFFHSDESHFLQSWVYKYLRYPAEAVKNGIQGTVLVSFVVEKDGSVTNIRVEKGVDELLDDEALRVMNVSPKWIPGKIMGEKVRTRVVLPIEFRLTDSKSFKLRLKK